MNKKWIALIAAGVGVFLLAKRAYAESSLVTDTLLDAIEKVESGGKATAVSPKGAHGAYQFMPKTWTWIWTDIIKEPSNADFKLAYDRDLSRRAAKAYFQWIAKYLDKRKLLTLDNLIASYNAGQGAVVKAGGVPAIKETQDYVARVKKAMGVAE